MYTLYTNLSFYITLIMFHYNEQGQFCKSVSLQISYLKIGGVFFSRNYFKRMHKAPQKLIFSI